MKKIQRRVSQISAMLLSGIITAMGFTSCKQTKKAIIDGSTPIDSGIMVMYGVPQNVYKLAGIVTDSDGKPVEGVDVQMQISTDGKDYKTVRSFRTAYNGNYLDPTLDEQIRLVVEAPGYKRQVIDVRNPQDLIQDRSKSFDFKLEKAD